MANSFVTRAASLNNTPLLMVMGEIYKVTPAQYKKYLQAVANGKDPDINLFGKYIGTMRNVTDLDKYDAKDLLDSL